MSDIDISKMNYKELRNEVQAIRDELAMFKRKFEDAIYNLDDSNFGKAFTFEKENMKSQIKMTAEKIESTVSKDDLEKYSTIEQTAEQIRTTVTDTYVNSLIGGTYVTNAAYESSITQTANDIKAEVKSEVYTREEVDTKISSVTVTDSQITAAVSKNYYTKTQVDNKISSITISVEGIESVVKNNYQTISDANEDYDDLDARLKTAQSGVNDCSRRIDGCSSRITQMSNEISMAVIDENNHANDTKFVFNKDGMIFYSVYPLTGKWCKDGWCFETLGSGGLLGFYEYGSKTFALGRGFSGYGYNGSDLCLKAGPDGNETNGRFIIDMANSKYREVKFTGLGWYEGNIQPCIYANELLLATQDWVREHFQQK